jgi:hypothetical protein
MKSHAMYTRTALIASAAALAVQGCAGVDAERKVGAVEIRPASKVADAGLSGVDLAYGSAARAIEARDYARALELLQVARARAPDDVRILNAFGVIYDKLGRFDLSQRYYTQAQTKDPASSIVAQNLAYSKTLRGEPITLAMTEVGEPVSVRPQPRVERAAQSVAQQVALQQRPTLPAVAPAPVRSEFAQAAPGPLPLVIASPAPPVAEPLIVRLAAVFRGAVTPLPTATVDAVPAQPAQRVVPPAIRATAAVPPRVLVRVTAAQHIPAAKVQKAATPSMVQRLIHPNFDLTAPAPSSEATLRRSIHKASLTPPAQVARPAASPPVRLVKVQAPRRQLLLGRPVTVVYASADRRKADQLRFQLARRGWTLAAANRRVTPPQVTTIRYEPSKQKIAYALARSLRIPVKFERCRNQCAGVTIFVGGRGASRTVGMR